MKNFTSILLLGIVLLSACGGTSDLDELKAEKAEIQGEIKELKTKLAGIEESIIKLDPSSKKEKLELVTVIDLDKTAFKNYIEAQGKTYSEDNVMVTTDMGGLVRAVYVDEGQYVSKGKVLIQLDNSVILSQLAELETSISLANDVYEKRKRLWDQNIGSEIEFLQAKNNYESLINKKASINTQLSKASIKSPINGYVDAINLNLGEMASPGMPACQVVNNKNMEVKVDLPESYLGKVKKGDEIIVEITALGVEKTAKVSAVGQTVNQFNRAFEIIASLENKNGDIKPNMLAKVKFTNEAVDDAIVIPTALLQKSAQGYFVFTADTDTTKNETVAIKKIIEVGESYDGNIVVTEGLTGDDVIINKGFRNVLDGQFIQIQE